MDRVFNFFEEILKIPRSSGNESKIADYLVEFADNHNLECTRDNFNNVFIKKNNYSNSTIILQAHSDMVCVSNTNYDFDNNGIEYYIDGDYYKGKNSSLGADDGIGIAIILGILEEKDNMPNIEAMITTQEETTMSGALNFNYSLLTGKTLISLDGIKEADIESSSAGMCSITLNKKIKFGDSNDKSYKLSISGLAGGHSGDDIHKNRCNAIKLMASLIEKLGYLNIANISMGEKDNVIPNSGYCIFTSKLDLGTLQDKINNIDLKLVNEDNNLKIIIEEINDNKFILNSIEIVDFINQLEDGLLGVFENDNFPLLSSNIGKIFISNDELIIKMSIRSSDSNKLENRLKKVETLCNKYNFKFNVDANKPFFPFKENSKTRMLLEKTYKDLYGQETTIKKVHACMEGGVFSSNIDNLDMCTIAPTINDCHTTNERVSISSTRRVYGWLKETLIRFNKNKKR